MIGYYLKNINFNSRFFHLLPKKDDEDWASKFIGNEFLNFIQAEDGTILAYIEGADIASATFP